MVEVYTSKSKIEACPFCNSRAKINHTGHDRKVDLVYWVVCTVCGACGPFADIEKGCNIKEKAIEFWNRRGFNLEDFI